MYLFCLFIYDNGQEEDKDGKEDELESGEEEGGVEESGEDEDGSREEGEEGDEDAAAPQKLIQKKAAQKPVQKMAVQKPVQRKAALYKAAYFSHGSWETEVAEVGYFPQGFHREMWSSSSSVKGEAS